MGTLTQKWANDRDVAMQNQQVAEYAKQKYAQDQAHERAMENAKLINVGKLEGKREYLDGLAAASMANQVVQPAVIDPRFAQPTMRAAMQPYGLAEQQYTNQYNGGMQ